MAADLTPLSLTQLQNHNQQNLMAAPWVSNPKSPPDDDSWEVKAFAQDTGHVMGTTWPPRSYTCTFCRREFRSAQALGGHMNVHRRDRALLHQSQPGVPLINQNLSPSTQEFATNGGLCFFYQLPTPNGVLNSPPINARSISSYPFNNLMAPPGSNNSSSSLRYSIAGAEPADNNLSDGDGNNNISKEASTEELDLELRLGHR
ncbi:hypothetical protein GQ457_08G025370 [Hibiscus cannabinus]